MINIPYIDVVCDSCGIDNRIKGFQCENPASVSLAIIMVEDQSKMERHDDKLLCVECAKARKPKDSYRCKCGGSVFHRVYDGVYRCNSCKATQAAIDELIKVGVLL